MTEPPVARVHEYPRTGGNKRCGPAQGRMMTILRQSDDIHLEWWVRPERCMALLAAAGVDRATGRDRPGTVPS